MDVELKCHPFATLHFVSEGSVDIFQSMQHDMPPYCSLGVIQVSRRCGGSVYFKLVMPRFSQNILLARSCAHESVYASNCGSEARVDILALNMVLPLPHKQYGDTLYFSSPVYGHHIRPLGEILSIH